MTIQESYNKMVEEGSFVETYESKELKNLLKKCIMKQTLKNEARKIAREWLVNALREPFNEIVYQAKLTPRQSKIINMKHLEGLCNFQIAMALSVSPETIRNEMASIYDRVYAAIGSVNGRNIKFNS